MSSANNIKDSIRENLVILLAWIKKEAIKQSLVVLHVSLSNRLRRSIYISNLILYIKSLRMMVELKSVDTLKMIIFQMKDTEIVVRNGHNVNQDVWSTKLGVLIAEPWQQGLKNTKEQAVLAITTQR